ncbi:hypothetical protein [Pseudorhodoferax sp.]|uniref:hypothetical protein n=1 Tax=Pseudorhodoferax sp. TaxID=1993553 RepID=UPI002DD645FF|nr:hypothetical protein [Pseudorhodoferax sp.]
MTNDNIPALTIEANDDGTLTLQQDWCGNVDRVAVHRVHVRQLAEHMGLIAVDTECPPSKSTAELQRENDRLKRSMLRLRDRALRLQKDFSTGADWAHADLSTEMADINFLVELFDQAVDDFAEGNTAHCAVTHALVTGDRDPHPVRIVESSSADRSRTTPKPSAKPLQKAHAQLELPA